MTADAQPADWPKPTFTFLVEIEGVGTNIRFQEVSGLDVESQPIEFRHGNSPSFSTIKMPGIQKSGNVTLKRGIFAKDSKLFEWMQSIKGSSVKRSAITIKLVDERGMPTMTWKLANAWPAKISGTDLKASGNEVAVESLELAHEGLTVDNK